MNIIIHIPISGLFRPGVISPISSQVIETEDIFKLGNKECAKKNLHTQFLFLPSSAPASAKAKLAGLS